MKKVYLIIAAMMLLCLAPMPYGYFQLVRFLSTIAFGVMAYRYFMEKKNGWPIHVVLLLYSFSLSIRLHWAERYGILWML